MHAPTRKAPPKKIDAGSIRTLEIEAPSEIEDLRKTKFKMVAECKGHSSNESDFDPDD